MVFGEFITHFRKAVDGCMPTQSEKHTRLIPAVPIKLQLLKNTCLSSNLMKYFYKEKSRLSEMLWSGSSTSMNYNFIIFTQWQEK